MKRSIIIGVMGPGSATNKDLENAYKLGQLIASEGWILLNGGRNAGVMEASSKGAKSKNGLCLGILPDNDRDKISDYVDIPVITDMGSGRNNINVLSSDVVVACGMGTGTASEVALALKAGKSVILLQSDNKMAYSFFKELEPKRVFASETAEKSIVLIKNLLDT